MVRTQPAALVPSVTLVLVNIQNISQLALRWTQRMDRTVEMLNFLQGVGNLWCPVEEQQYDQYPTCSPVPRAAQPGVWKFLQESESKCLRPVRPKHCNHPPKQWVP